MATFAIDNIVTGQTTISLSVTAGVSGELLSQPNPRITAAFSGTALVTPTNNYRMRGYDNTLTTTVYWTATSVDSTGAQYTGPGPLTNITIVHILS
jgi:hypothetical protein